MQNTNTMTPKHNPETGNTTEQQSGDANTYDAVTKQYLLKPVYHSTPETGFFREVLLLMIPPRFNAYSDLVFKT